MTGFSVAQLAKRAGVPTSTVRFYDRNGLLTPATRAGNGYRVYDETALTELAFINRAKGIGMNLDEIRELLGVWPTGECRLLQAQLGGFLTERISHTRQQINELTAFENQLNAVLDRLGDRAPGPEQCGHGCGCEADLEQVTIHQPRPFTGRTPARDGPTHHD